MRQVTFKKWIPYQYDENKKYIENTGRFETDFIHAGIFHQWGASYDEFESGPGNYTVGIIELPDGTIEAVLPHNIKFSNPS